MTKPLTNTHTPRRCPGLTRRQLLQAGSLATLGLSLPALMQSRVAATGGASPRARACIVVYQIGGPAQHETFDPKPNAPEDFRGEFQPIATSLPGVLVSEHLPRLAQLAHKYAIIRSCTHNDPEHNSACHAYMTGRMHPRRGQIVPPSPDDFPPYGAVVSRLRPTLRPVPNWVTMPDYLMNGSVPYPSQNAGFLGPSHDPFTVRADPNQENFQIQGLALTPEAGAGLTDRANLLAQVNQQSPALAGEAADSLDACYQRAFDLLAAPDTRAAFDLAREPAALRDRYGRTTWGQCLLLARRLVEAGVPLVTVNLSQNGSAVWDTHGNNFTTLRQSLLPRFDQSFSALLEDLDDRSLLAETLVLAGGEFGRTPRVNSGAGRDHWPWVYSVVLAGGGVRGGLVHGASDPYGAYPSSQPVAPGDLAATVYHSLGLAPSSEIHDRLGRPFPIALGQILSSLLD
jgi:uncharacterized protein (DUF1501 family)